MLQKFTAIRISNTTWHLLQTRITIMNTAISVINEYDIKMCSKADPCGILNLSVHKWKGSRNAKRILSIRQIQKYKENTVYSWNNCWTIRSQKVPSWPPKKQTMGNNIKSITLLTSICSISLSPSTHQDMEQQEVNKWSEWNYVFQSHAEKD
jgi:hypothetical protein